MATSHPTSPTPNEGLTLAEKVRAWADGSPTAEAAAIIATETINGRLLDTAPLIGENDQIAEINWDAYRATTGYLSGGERRLFALADSLATGHSVDLNDSLTGLDDRNGLIVLEAIAHALHQSGALR